MQAGEKWVHKSNYLINIGIIFTHFSLNDIKSNSKIISRV